MILFTILAITALMLTVVVILGLAVGGTAFIVVFGDVIVCVFLIVWIIKKLFKRKR